MSHIVKMGLVVTDLDAFKSAIKQFPELEFMQDQKTMVYYGPAGGKCDHAVRIRPESYGQVGFRQSGRTKVPYEVGLVKRADGNGYDLVYDNFCGGFGLEKVIGEQAGKLKQEYALQVHTRTAQRQGLRVTRKVLPNGHVQLVAQTR